MRILQLILGWLIAFVFGTSPSLAHEGLSNYWQFSEYLHAHPDQIPLSDTFSAEVRQAALPLTLTRLHPVKIAVIYPGEQISDYWRRNIYAFEARLKELSIPYQLTSYFTKPSLEAREQSHYLLKALKNDPDYLVFTLDTLRHKTFIERIISKGKPKIILQNITTPLKAWRDKQPFFYVGFDHATGSQMLADYYRKAFPQDADYAVLYFSKGYVSDARGNTFIDAIQKNSTMTLKTAYYTKANRSSAYEAALSTLKEYPQLDFFYACATDVALGAVDAIKQQGLQGKVQVNGWGGGSRELEALTNKELDATVMRMNDDTGVAMAEAIKRDLQKQPVPLVYSGELKLITKEISKEALSALEQQAFRYSNH